MLKRSLAIAVGICALSASVFAGGEILETDGPRRMPAPAKKWPAARAITPSKIRPVSRPGDLVTRNLPLPAPVRGAGWGKEANDFYGPTYYYPSAHNHYEGLNPTYYPFLKPGQHANYKVPGVYCPGRLCGSSRSNWYWDSYDDWKRGGRYEQHQ